MGVEAESISCLAKLEQGGDDAEAIDSCFPECERLTAERLDDSLLRIGEEVHQTMGKLETMGREMESLSDSLKWLLKKSGHESSGKTALEAGVAPPFSAAASGDYESKAPVILAE